MNREPTIITLRDGARRENISVGENVVSRGKTYIQLRKNGKITIKDNVEIGTDTWLVAANDAELYIGENTILGPYNILNGGHGIALGKHCVTAAFVYINSSEHEFRRDTLIQKQGYYGRPVLIGDDVWVGGHVLITKGVQIGTGAVIGGGSVVTKDVPEYKIVAGNPARVIGERK